MERGRPTMPGGINFRRPRLNLFNYNLCSAVQKGDEAAVRSILSNCRDHLEDVDRHGWTVLHHACKKGHQRIAELLLDNGASVHSGMRESYESPLHAAVSSGCEDTVALLLRKGADVGAWNRAGNTPLHDAAAAPDGRCEKIIQILLSHRAVIEAANNHNETPLSMACKRGGYKAVNLLIRSGADIHRVDTHKTTLIHLAATRKSSDGILELLLDLKAAGVDALDNYGRTPLHVACEYSNLNTAKRLLRSGARVNYKSPSNGSTALHIAAQNDSLEITKLLLKYNADINVENEAGQTPLKCATGHLSPDVKVNEFLVKQLVKMKTLNLFISESNLKELSENVKAKSFSAACEHEIGRTRNSAIGDSSVKMYDILTKGENQLADYVSNELVETILTSENYEAEFPIYESEIREKFLQGRERRDLLRQSSEWLWTAINEFYELPYIIVERINRCLTNDDLALQINQDYPSQQEDVSVKLQKLPPPILPSETLSARLNPTKNKY